MAVHSLDRSPVVLHEVPFPFATFNDPPGFAVKPLVKMRLLFPSWEEAMWFGLKRKWGAFAVADGAHVSAPIRAGRDAEYGYIAEITAPVTLDWCASVRLA